MPRGKTTSESGCGHCWPTPLPLNIPAREEPSQFQPPAIRTMARRSGPRLKWYLQYDDPIANVAAALPGVSISSRSERSLTRYFAGIVRGAWRGATALPRLRYAPRVPGTAHPEAKTPPRPQQTRNQLLAGCNGDPLWRRSLPVGCVYHPPSFPPPAVLAIRPG